MDAGGAGDVGGLGVLGNREPGITCLEAPDIVLVGWGREGTLYVRVRETLGFDEDKERCCGGH